MVEVTVYTTATCPYCHAAKALLERKKVPFHEIDVTGNATERMRLVERTGGRRTVPQIFIGDRSIGGYDELSQLEQSGRLDPLLAGG